MAPRPSPSSGRVLSRQQKVVALVAIGVILGCMAWLAYVSRPREAARGLSTEAQAFIQRAQERLADGPFADIALVLTEDLQGIVVQGDVATSGDLAELKKRIESLSSSIPVEYHIAVARP